MSQELIISIVNRNEIEGEGLRRILTETSFHVAGVYKSPADVSLSYDAEGRRPLLIIVSSTDDATLTMCRQARAAAPDALIIMMGCSCDSSVIAKAFRTGVDGYVSKDTRCACLPEMIRLVAVGEKLIPSEVVFDLVGLETPIRWSETDGRLEDVNISDREIEILRGLIRGDPNKIISRTLNITLATVKVHVKSILRKLHVVNRTQAAIWAINHGLTGNYPTAPAHETEVPKEVKLNGYAPTFLPASSTVM